MNMPSFVSGQYTSAPKPIAHKSTLTGCLLTSDDDYVLIVEDGETWQLHSDSAKFDGEIAHTVAVTGMVSHPVMRKMSEDTKAEI